MRYFFVSFFIACSVLVATEKFNINMTLVTSFFEFNMLSLLGLKSSQFPDEDFLNLILYGHKDVPYSYQDYLNDFGQDVSYYPYPGAIIIGKDGRLGGVIEQNGDYAVINIPGSIITEVPVDHLDKMFPKGYVVRFSSTTMFFWGQGIEDTYFNDISVCNQCNTLMGFSYGYEDFLFPNNVFYKSVRNSDESFWLNTYGYVKSYDETSKTGIIKISFYSIAEGDDFNHYFIDPSYGDEISIDLSSGIMEYSGRFKGNYNKVQANFTFAGNYNFN